MAGTPSKIALGAALCVAFALLGTPASAQIAFPLIEGPVDLFLPAPDQAGFTGFAGTRTPGPWGVDGTLWLDYGFRTYAPRSGDTVRHRLDGTAIAQLGVLSRGALAVRMPFVLVQRGEGALGAPALATSAAGNPALEGRIRVLGAPVRPDGSVQDGAAMGLRGIVHLPVGTSDAYFASEAWRGEAALIGDIEMFGIGAGAALAYRYNPDGPRDTGRDSHGLRLSVGLRLPLPLMARAFPGRVQEAALLELDVDAEANDDMFSASTVVEGRLGYRVIVGDLFGTLMFGAGLTDALGRADFRTLLGLGWSPRQHDQDADGVADSADQCAHLPEDRDGFEDEDGCADDDNDGDLIVDEDDRCPLQPAEMDRDDDEDGCTDP